LVHIEEHAFYGTDRLAELGVEEHEQVHEVGDDQDPVQSHRNEAHVLGQEAPLVHLRRRDQQEGQEDEHAHDQPVEEEDQDQRVPLVQEQPHHCVDAVSVLFTLEVLLVKQSKGGKSTVELHDFGDDRRVPGQLQTLELLRQVQVQGDRVVVSEEEYCKFSNTS
ncbi:MAG: hypothetical protein AAFO91_08680, partial [Bacteroidota bacterium]